MVGLIGGLELVLHQVAVAERAPEIAVGIVDLQGPTEVFDGLAWAWGEAGGGRGAGGKGKRGRGAEGQRGAER